MKDKKRPSEEHHKPSEERSVTGDIKVHGAVQVFEAQEAIEQHNAERKEDNTYKAASKDFEKSYLVVSRGALIITAVYLAVTSFIFWESKRSADAAESAAKTAELSLKIGERPYLWAPAMIPQSSFPSKERVQIDIQIYNYGKTPAMDVHPAFNVFINDMKIPRKTDDKGQGILPPGATLTDPFWITPDNEAVFRDVESGKSKFSIRGTITYTDVFQDSHITEVCSLFNPQDQKFKFCDSGNEIH
jgi:hypothetical protein